MDKTINKKLAKRIKALRGEAGLSQQELAERLGISRPTISQIENDERKITADELKKLADIFNVSSDDILNHGKSIKVVLEKGKSKKGKEEIRISVPQENVEKFKEVLLYILNKVGAKPNIGETVLYKLLYFIDFNFYEKYEEQLIGATYIKNHHGPTPVEFHKIIDQMKKNKEIIEVQKEFFKYPQRKYLPLRKPDLKKLRAHEKEVIDKVLERHSDKTAKEISEYSHNDVPWVVTEYRKIIEYETVFYRTKEYSERNISDEDRLDT
ncbi:MAG: DUF4065 domain-containing protein [Caldisericaceae bacterium]|nr:DUF4065 domain-containing protein [Caldisericaceae bacterium]